jgi:hypothetical protein
MVNHWQIPRAILQYVMQLCERENVSVIIGSVVRHTQYTSERFVQEQVAVRASAYAVCSARSQPIAAAARVCMQMPCVSIESSIENIVWVL